MPAWLLIVLVGVLVGLLFSYTAGLVLVVIGIVVLLAHYVPRA